MKALLFAIGLDQVVSLEVIKIMMTKKKNIPVYPTHRSNRKMEQDSEQDSERKDLKGELISCFLLAAVAHSICGATRLPL
mmetsp:Transcript_33783/g.39717  ORF Transcript_33783/g.39717 Transcript_33783/m.39717 type:complete len:80 (+) Transcript_33783:312-551(+)